MAADAAGPTGPTMLQFFPFDGETVKTKYPVFNWDKIPATAMTRQKSDNVKGYEMYTDNGLQILGKRAKTQFGMGRGGKKKEKGDGDGDASALGGTNVGGTDATSIALGGKKEEERIKRPQYETNLSNEDAENLLETTFGKQFIDWFLKNWDVLMANCKIFKRVKKSKRRELLSARNFVRGPVKVKDEETREKYGFLDKNPYTLRHKMIERRGMYQTRLIVDDGKGTHRTGSAADIRPFSDVMEFSTFHIIINDEHIELLLIARSVIVYPEEEAPTVDWSAIGLTSAPVDNNKTNNKVDAHGDTDMEGGGDDDGDDDGTMEMTSDGRMDVEKAMALVM